MHVDGDFLGEVAVGDGNGHVGDVSDLGRQIAGHEVDAIDQVFPGTGDARNDGLAAQFAFGADLAGNAGHFGGETAQLVDHRVDGILELQDFAAHIDGDFLGEVAVGDGDGHVGDVSDLSRQIAGHEIHAFGQIFPNAAHVANLRLPAELAFGADFAGDAGRSDDRRVELDDHRVDRVFELQDFAMDVDGDFLREVAVGHGDCNFGDVADLSRQITRHEVDALGQIFPNTAHVTNLRLAAELAFGADFAGDAGDFGGERIQLIDHRVDRFFELQDFAVNVDGDFLREVTIGDRDRGIGDVSHLAGQLAGYHIDAVGEILPRSGDAGDQRLPTELAFGADFPGNAGHFGCETPQLIDHGVDRIFELQNLTLNVDGDFFREVAVGDGDGHIGDISHLRGQVARHRVDTVSQIFPGSGHPGHDGLAAELAVRADFARATGQFV